MTDYNKATDFAGKDSLTSGDPLKIVKGTEIDDEFNAIAVAVATKANTAAPIFTGAVTMPTLIVTSSTTLQGTANFSSLAISDLGSVTTADINGGTIDGVAIGATTPGAGTFSSLVATTADINAGTIDNTTIGATTPFPGTFTSLDVTSDLTSKGIQDSSSAVGKSIYIAANGDINISSGAANVSHTTGYVEIDTALAIAGTSTGIESYTTAGSAPTVSSVLHQRKVYSQNASLSDIVGGQEVWYAGENWTDSFNGTVWTMSSTYMGGTNPRQFMSAWWEDVATPVVNIGLSHWTNLTPTTNYANLFMRAANGAIVQFLDQTDTVKGSVAYGNVSDVLTINNNTTDGDIQLTVDGAGEVKGLLRGGAITGDSSQFKVESALPGTTDTNTIYFIV